MKNEDLIYRLLKRAEIRRQIKTRKSVQNNEPDRISDLLEEAAKVIEAYDFMLCGLNESKVERYKKLQIMCGTYPTAKNMLKEGYSLEVASYVMRRKS